ncbi:DNA polymerase III subunits gamma and tau [compost metagenome]
MAEAFTRSQLFRIIDTLNHYQTEMKYALQPQTLFEVALLKLCSIPQNEEVSQGQAMSSAAIDSTASSSEVQQLRRQLTELEKKLERALQGGLSGSGQDAGNKGNRPASRASAPRVSSKAKLPSGIDRYVAQRSSPEFTAVQSKWNQVLQGVKDEKITIHAWFVNGEPVSVLEDAVLVAFKNDIHRETTEKPANKQLIEVVIERVLGSPYRLVTMMLKDWNDSIEGTAAEPSKEEPFQLEPGSEDGGGGSKEPWVDEALQMFGDDLVVVKE